MAVAHLDRRLLAILAADVVGYSTAMEADEAGTIARLKATRAELTDPLVAEHHGRIIKLMGDGAIVAFDSVVDAVSCAVAVQRAMAARNADLREAERLVFRIGVNLGDVALVDGDVYGDGVNVAARLQELADPGGVMVSGTAFDHLQGKLDLPLDDAGEQHVKNIARPVRAYRVRLDGARARRRTLQGTGLGRHPGLAAAILMFLAILGGGIWWLWPQAPAGPEGEPGLAVLPFQNMSGDPDATYLGQGVAEDIITLLASYPGIRVVSRTSSFVYDKPAPVQEIGKALGARYVVEGSVRKVGNQIRITAQLIDAESGEHVWADTYDRTGSDVLGLQEDFANKLYDTIAGISGKVWQDETRRAWSKSPLDLAEYDYYLRGHKLFMTGDNADGPRAREIWQEGLARFPDSALLRIKLAFSFNRDLLRGISTDPQADLAHIERLAAEARAIPDKSKLETWLGHWLDSYVAYWREDWPRAVAEAEGAARLVPNDAMCRGDLAYILAMAGRTGDAVAWGEEALRRDPNGPSWYRTNLGFAFLLDGRPADALAAVEPLTEFEPIVRTAALARLGRSEGAKRSIGRLLAENPGWTVAKEASFPMIESLERPYLDDLRKAGLPE